MRKLGNKIIITRLPSKQDMLITARMEAGKLVELDCEKKESSSILGNIYIGKVKNIVSNINAAFIEIAPGQECYYSLEENQSPIFLNPKQTNKMVIGDEVVVQVAKENLKTKAPVVTSNLNIPGKYLVLTSENKKIGVSSKLSESEKKQVKNWISPLITDKFGVVIRTNALHATQEQLQQELEKLSACYQKIMHDAASRTCYSILYQSSAGFYNHIRNANSNSLEEVVTDQADVYENLKEYLSEEQPEDLDKLLFYEDVLLPLSKLYRLETALQEALNEKVWLKSGAYLVIQPTEAFTVIDVNTGKFTGNKKSQETFFKINLEAAKEIARQLRLRNISGIVVIDFIDLPDKEKQNELLASLSELLKRDPIQTTLVGISKLNLVELTRKKVRKSLREQVGIVCPSCKGRGFLW